MTRCAFSLPSGTACCDQRRTETARLRATTFKTDRAHSHAAVVVPAFSSGRVHGATLSRSQRPAAKAAGFDECIFDAAGTSRRTLFIVLAGLHLGWRSRMLATVAEESRPDAPIADSAGILSPTTNNYLTGIIRQLESETGVKVRIVCPPPDLQQGRDAWSEYYRPLRKAWALDESGLLIVARQPAGGQGGSTGGSTEGVRMRDNPKQLGLLTINAGLKLQEKFQYTLTRDYALRTASRFGSPEYITKFGLDLAIKETAENVVAGIHSLLDRRKDGAKVRVVRGLRDPLPAEEVSEILGRHPARP